MYEAALLFLQNFRLYRVDGCVEFLYTAYEKSGDERSGGSIRRIFHRKLRPMNEKALRQDLTASE